MIFCVCRLPEDGTQAPIYVEAILIMNCVVWFVIYCILLFAFAGQYIECTTRHGVTSIRLG